MLKLLIEHVCIVSLLMVVASPCWGSPTQERIEQTLQAGKPVVIQVSVALADNKNQGIAPVPAAIGNGQESRTNLYWGARYGLKTFLTRDSGWTRVASPECDDSRILERIVLKKEFVRKSNSVTLYLVADAWDGKYIDDTIRQFLRYNAGHDTIRLMADGHELLAGGSAHLIVYIGHNALLDYGGQEDTVFPAPQPNKNNPGNDAIVLACKSFFFFTSLLERTGSYPLVLTTGLMAPEAYSLSTAIEAWISGADDNAIRKAAARGYNKYQKTGTKAAERLFAAH